jgi:opacity protein-like surface antigen
MASFERVRHLAPAAALGLLALLCSPSAVSAQALPPARSLDVTPFFGFTFGTDQEGPTSTLGVGIAYNWTDQLAFEGELGIVPDLEGDTSSVDIGLVTVSANGVYHFDAGSDYVPYATFGLGFGRASFDFPELADDSHTELAINLGGGVKKAINPKLSWRADLRYFNVNDDNPNFWRVYGGVIFHFKKP